MNFIRTQRECEWCDSIALIYNDHVEHQINCPYCGWYGSDLSKILCPRTEKIDHDKLSTLYSEQQIPYFLILIISEERDYIFNIGNWILAPSWYHDYEHTIPDYRSYHAWYIHRDLRKCVDRYFSSDEHLSFIKPADYIDTIIDTNNTHINDLIQLQEEGSNKINEYYGTNINFHITAHYPVHIVRTTLHFHFRDEEMYTIDKNKMIIERRFSISISQVIEMITRNTMRSYLKSECCVCLQCM